MSANAMTSPALHVPMAHVHGPRLVGGWRYVGMSAWAVVWLVSLTAFFLAIYVYYRWDSTPIAVLAQSGWPVEAESQTLQNAYQAALYEAGLSLPAYGGFFAGLRLLSGIPYFVLSVLIVRRRSDRLMAVLFAVILAVMGAAGRWIVPNWLPLPGMYPWAQLPVSVLGFLLDCSLIMAYAFPDGRFVPRWTRWLAPVVVLLSLGRNILADTALDPDLWPGFPGATVSQLLLLVGLCALAYRYRRDANAVQKRQIQWIVVGAVLLGLFYFAHYLIYDTHALARWIPVSTPGEILVTQLILEPGWYVAQAALAVSIGLAVFRYRLWDIDLVINRVLVYGSLTLLTLGSYLAAVAALGSLFRGVADPVVFFLATGFVAILFEPLRQRLQRWVNRLMYGERDDPYAVLTRLSNTLEHAPGPADMLPALAKTIGQALKTPFVAVVLHENGLEQTAARYGTPQSDHLDFPIVYQAETVGFLRVAPRARGEALSAADRRLLENMAQQAGAVAQAVRLHGELVRSRAAVVAAREEERRRLRRDLHDGLGPILASQTLKMAAVRQLVRQNPERAEAIVDDVIHHNENTVSEVRRLVYGLRPPALDELGLVEAVRDFIRRGGQDDLTAGGLRIQVVEPEEGLPQLPAAVEVNAYRIALEALTNAARHAQARHCTVHFRCDEPPHNDTARPVLWVEITDDGVGMPERYRAGVGVRAMRERAEELGGQLRITPGSPQGTQVSAWLPLIG